MSYELDAARRYRAHAKDLRTIAGEDLIVENRRMLLAVADDYERSAADMEGIAAMHNRRKYHPA